VTIFKTAIAIKGAKVLEWRSLRDIDLGICDALTYDQIQTHFPDEFKSRTKNKMTYRYPGGESYTDLLHRLEPVLFEMERATSPLVIVAHQAVLRCLYAYFLDFPHEELPFLAIPLVCYLLITKV
jgi:broad specificity phosphatase PhoE